MMYANASANARDVRQQLGLDPINEAVTLYVRLSGNDGTDFMSAQTNADGYALATLRGAFALLNNYTIGPAGRVTIQMEKALFYDDSSVSLCCDHPNGSRLSINGVSTAAAPSAMTTANTTTLVMPNINNPILALGLNPGSSLYSLNNMFISGNGGNNTYGLYVGNACIVYDVGNVRVSNCQFGICSIYNSIVTGCHLSTSGVALIDNVYGVYVSYSSTYTCGGASITNTYIDANGGGYGLWAGNGSLIYVSNAVSPVAFCVIKNTATAGILAQSNSEIFVRGVTVNTGITGRAVQSTGNSYVLVSGGTYRGSTNTLYADTGSFVKSTSIVLCGTTSPTTGVVGNQNSYIYDT